MVVLSIMLILLAIAMPIYSQSVNHAREEAFRKNLQTINRMIVQYTLDKQKAPQSLQDLVTAGYFSAKNGIPPDITGKNTWETEEDTSIMALDQKDTGIVGVHSGSSRVGSDGKPYSEW